MLTAWDKTHEAALALPDFEKTAALAQVRERTRRGALVCPTCREALWLRAGDVRIPHFAHRQLSDCPHGRVSESVLAARRLLYRFFQARIGSGKLSAQVLLEPRVPGLPEGLEVDLMLQRKGKSTVNVALIERNLKPELRARLHSSLSVEGRVFRPVFLIARLRHPQDDPELFLLDPTQREFRLSSEYDLLGPSACRRPPGTLHFIDPATEAWTSLRALSVVHSPQAFGSRAARCSKMDPLLWSETYAEWTHEGEAAELKAFRAQLETERKAVEAIRRQRELEAARRAQAEAQRRQRQIEATIRPEPGAPGSATSPPKPRPSARPSHSPPQIPVAALPEQPDPMPKWIARGLVCTGCGKRTADWQNAEPNKDRCVCRSCFAAGVRLK